MKKFAAGILPKYNDYYLLGLESHKTGGNYIKKQWSAFAGMGDYKETPYMTACREFFEESCGILGDVKEENVLSCVTDIHKTFEFYMFIVDFSDDNSIDINDVTKFKICQQKYKNIHMLEKECVRWFHKDDIIKLNLRKPFKKLYCDKINNKT